MATTIYPNPSRSEFHHEFHREIKPPVAVSKERELFESLARLRPLTPWLEAQLQNEYKTLVAALDIDQVRRAQGAARFIQTMLRGISSAEPTL